jgi:type III restriction enzyme
LEVVDSASGETKEDEAAYDLIMKDKETLLSFPSAGDDAETRAKKQVCFIFSHSALREGWDNPNVFQICTLNQTASPMKKRQEVGRGVRLAVDQSGNRVRDERVNILTVVANESYRRYVETLQSEIAAEYITEIEARYGKPIGGLTDEERRRIEEEYGEGILPPPPRPAGAPPARLRKARVLSREFQDLWDRIKHKTRYSVRIDTEKILGEAVAAIDRASIAPPRVTVTRSQVRVGDDNMFEALQLSAARTAVDLSGRYPLPNLIERMADLMEHTTPPVRLTRRTLLEVFKRIRNRKAAIANPHEFATVAVSILKEKMADHLIEGIQYEKINEWYEMRQILSEEAIELFNKHVVKDTQEKSIYDLIPCDSDVERRFVEDLEGREDIKLYLKLPQWFLIPTPVGDYRPDWAIVLEGAEKQGKPALYFVTETKGSLREDDLRPDERRKILCGAAHFGSKQKNRKGALEGVDYKVVTKAGELRPD